MKYLNQLNEFVKQSQKTKIQPCIHGESKNYYTESHAGVKLKYKFYSLDNQLKAKEQEFLACPWTNISKKIKIYQDITELKNKLLLLKICE